MRHAPVLLVILLAVTEFAFGLPMTYSNIPKRRLGKDDEDDEIDLGTLLIFYGIPSLINGCSSDIPCAANVLGAYDYIVLGDGLQDPSSQWYAETVAVMAHPSMENTMIFGYIDLGVSTQNLPLATIQERADQWKEIGANGIFLDDFGYDFQVSRERQNNAVDYIHSIDLPVFANGFFVDQVFGSEIGTFNPTGEATNLGSNDFYLFESYQVIESAYQTETAWRDKADALESYRQELDFAIMSITTCSDPCTYDQDQFFYTWWSALLDRHVATGWGEAVFSALTSVAPFRDRPEDDPGNKFLSDGISNSGTVWSQETDVGLVFVDTSHPTDPDDHYGIEVSDKINVCRQFLFARIVVPTRRTWFKPSDCLTEEDVYATCSC